MSAGMTEVPTEQLAAVAKWRALECDGEYMTSIPDDIEKSGWEILEDAEVHDCTYSDRNGMVEAWFETTVIRSCLTSRATHWQPAEYENEEHMCHITVRFELDDPMASPIIDIDIERY